MGINVLTLNKCVKGNRPNSFSTVARVSNQQESSTLLIENVSKSNFSLCV